MVFFYLNLSFPECKMGEEQDSVWPVPASLPEVPQTSPDHGLEVSKSGPQKASSFFKFCSRGGWLIWPRTSESTHSVLCPHRQALRASMSLLRTSLESGVRLVALTLTLSPQVLCARPAAERCAWGLPAVARAGDQ